MSGKLKAWSTVKNLSHIKKYLFNTAGGELEEDGAYNWDSDWGWEDVDIEDDDDKDGASWLDEVVIAMSSTGDVIAFAKDKRLVILGNSFDKVNGTQVMKIQYSGEPAHMYENEAITSVMCVPLHSLRQSSHGGPDWTCIVVGFASGFVRFYSDNGGEVLSQRLHNTPVIRFRLRTYEPPRHTGSYEQSDELTVLYNDAMVSVEGLSLYQSLRACRNHLARASAGGSSGLETPPLSSRKLAFKGQEMVVDHSSLGLVTPNRFDHLVTASLLGGPYASVGSTPPTHCVYAAGGRRPFVGLYYTSEEGWQPMLTDVARLVANKVKSTLFSAVPSWLGGRTSSSTSSEETEKVEPATSVTVRFGLPDKRREATAMEMAPDRRLAAIVDTFGRVLLVDLIRGTTLRMWKGYRDAQVAWLQRSEDSRSGTQRRRAVFLVVYAPRRGILEVWAMEQGPRVAAFNVGRCGRLLAADFRMLGLNPSSYRSAQPLLSLLYLDKQGLLSSLDIPFHLCLTDRSSHCAHDNHLLKQLRQLLRESSAVTSEETLIESIVAIVKEFRLVGLLEQAIERILNTKYLTVIVLEMVFKEIANLVSEDKICKMSPVPDKQRVALYVRNILNLVETFTLVQNLSLSGEDESMGATGERSETRTIEEIIAPHLPKEFNERIGRLTQVLDFSTAVAQLPKMEVRRRHFALSSAPLSVIHFLGFFYTSFQGRKDNDEAQYALRLSSKVDEQQKIVLGRFLFRSYLVGEASLDDLMERLKNSCIPQPSFLTVFLAYFLSESRHRAGLVDSSMALLQQLLHLKAETVTASVADVAALLDLVEGEMRGSQQLGAPLLLTISLVSVLRAEIQTRQKLAEEEADALSALLPQWLSLCRRCEDTLALQLLLVHAPVAEDPLPPPTTDGASTPTNSGPGTSLDSRPDLSVSLNRLKEGGRGFVTELVARWATRWRLTLADVKCLYYSLTEREDGEEEMEVDREGESPSTQELFALLVDHFPMALEMDSLLANVAWEYIFLWSKDMEEVSLLGTAVDCLRSLGLGGALISHGVASMAWHMHLEKIVQSATYLVEKVGGKTPKDRLCRKETNMTAACLGQFVHHAFEFMEIFKQANCDADVVPAFMLDESWRDNVDGRLSLVELAIDQPMTNYGLLLHHSHLLFVLDAVFTLDIRAIKPYSLFDQRGVNAFFKSLTSHPLLPGANVDAPVLNQRIRFLNKVLSASVRFLKERDDKAVHDFFREYTINQVSGELGIDVDAVRRQHIIELYSHGLDTIAEKELHLVHDLEVMTSQLLLIAGQRCAHMIFPLDEQTNLKRLGLMPPVLETYFKTSNYEDLACKDVAVVSTHRLVELILRYMTDDHPELHRARLIDDLLERFLNFGEEV